MKVNNSAKSSMFIVFSVGVLLLLQCSRGLTINRPGSKAFNRSWTNALVADSVGNFREAIHWYTEIITANYYDRSTVNALTNRGRTKVTMGDTIGGLKDLQRSVSILPTYPALISISLLHHNPDSSLRYSMRARAVAPDEPKVYFGIVGHYTLIAPNKDSALHYAHLLQRFKLNAMMLNLLTTTYLEFGDHDKLIAVADEIILNDPKDAYAYNNRGFGYLMKAKYKTAKNDINKSLALDPTNAYAYKNLGLLFLNTGRIDSACIQFKSAIERGFSSQYGGEVDSLQSIHCKNR